jgi:2'-phosphotransferase
MYNKITNIYFKHCDFFILLKQIDTVMSAQNKQGNNRYRKKRRTLSKNENENISKKLSKLLRHTGINKGLIFRTDAYTKLDDIIQYFSKTIRGRKITVNDITDIVDGNKKKRFQIIVEDGISWIKANQGHTLIFEDIHYTLITSVDDISQPVHGTYLDCLDSIIKNGLNKMGRTHIHFSNGVPDFAKADVDGKKRVISGMRGNCQVMIYLDVLQCLDNGIELFLSDNDVVLTNGVDGILDPKYFMKIIDAKTGVEMTFS